MNERVEHKTDGEKMCKVRVLISMVWGVKDILITIVSKHRPNAYSEKRDKPVAQKKKQRRKKCALKGVWTNWTWKIIWFCVEKIVYFLSAQNDGGTGETTKRTNERHFSRKNYRNFQHFWHKRHTHTIGTWVCADAECLEEMEGGETVKSRANKSPTTIDCYLIHAFSG